MTRALLCAVTPNCLTNYQLIQVAVKARGVEIELEKIEDMATNPGVGIIDGLAGRKSRRRPGPEEDRWLIVITRLAAPYPAEVVSELRLSSDISAIFLSDFFTLSPQNRH